MSKKMKKIIVTFLVLILTIPTFAKSNHSYSVKYPKYDYSGTYINEEINVPITKIGIPKEFFENQEESGLEISWNKWRADVSNELAARLQNVSLEYVRKIMMALLDPTSASDISNFPHDFMCLVTAKVNSDRTVENVITFIIPRESFDIEQYHVYANKNSKIYLYSTKTKEYYRWLYQGEPIDFNVDNGNGDEKVIKKLLSNGDIVDQDKSDVLFPEYLEKVANQVSGLAGKHVIKFPQLSKRKYVNIYFGTTDILEIQTIRKATEDMYNDIERHK